MDTVDLSSATSLFGADITPAHVAQSPAAPIPAPIAIANQQDMSLAELYERARQMEFKVVPADKLGKVFDVLEFLRRDAFTAKADMERRLARKEEELNAREAALNHREQVLAVRERAVQSMLGSDLPAQVKPRRWWMRKA